MSQRTYTYKALYPQGVGEKFKELSLDQKRELTLNSRSILDSTYEIKGAVAVKAELLNNENKWRYHKES